MRCAFECLGVKTEGVMPLPGGQNHLSVGDIVYCCLHLIKICTYCQSNVFLHPIFPTIEGYALPAALAATL